MPSFHEHTVNIALAAALQKMRRAWNVNGERVGVIAESSERPDIIVRQQGKPTIVIETNSIPHPASKERRSIVWTSGSIPATKNPKCHRLNLAVAPENGARRQSARRADRRRRISIRPFRFHRRQSARSLSAAWLLAGNLADLAGFVYRAAISEEAVSGAVIALETAVKAAEYRLKEADADNPISRAESAKH